MRIDGFLTFLRKTDLTSVFLGLEPVAMDFENSSILIEEACNFLYKELDQDVEVAWQGYRRSYQIVRGALLAMQCSSCRDARFVLRLSLFSGILTRYAKHRTVVGRAIETGLSPVGLLNSYPSFRDCDPPLLTLEEFRLIPGFLR